MGKKLYILLLSLLITLELMSQTSQTAHKHKLETDYLLYLPVEYAVGDKDWPLVLFLHGAGERGDDLDLVKKHGPPKLVDEDSVFKFVLASPQCPQGKIWSKDILRALLDEIIENYRIDIDRIYVTGLSMGGYGTWELATAYPEMFAAIAPICGGGDTLKAWRLRQMPIWAFHGEKDRVVPVSESTHMIEAVKAYNKEVKFTTYPEAGHDSWTESYHNQALYEWMLAQRRYQPPSISSDKWKKYEGTYRKDEWTSIKISKNNNKLMIKVNDQSDVPLIAESDSTFFLPAIIAPFEGLIEFIKEGESGGNQLIMHTDKGKTIAVKE